MGVSRIFYLFLGCHSLLIGLIPFFLPVYLIKTGHTLAQVSWFIALTGGGFCITLYLWDRVRLRTPFWVTLVFSFLVEIVLVVLLYIDQSQLLPLLALVNGVYNCLFWVVQRILFISLITPENSGRKFGNFQIYVLILLKSGIFLGGLLFETRGTGAVVLLSVTVALGAIVYFMLQEKSCQFPRGMQTLSPLSFTELLGFRDRFRSLLIFAMDGIFLFLESYFWLITLFIIVDESFWQLGLLVIILALIFSLLFISIKNRIDTINNQKIYILAVWLYLFSWVMRAAVSTQTLGSLAFVLLIVISFCTSFFRLAFNKRFFDIAQKDRSYRYIIIKSYVSQFCLALFFAGFALIIAGLSETELILRISYVGAAFATPLYLYYRNREC